jgi:glycosyltransferase involved in cell wall biosynthesis
MPNVLLLCEYATLSGGERSMLSTLDGVMQAGFGVAVAAPPEGPLAEAVRARGVEVVSFNVRQTLAPSTQSTARERLAELLRSRRPAIVHANSLAMGRLAGPVAADSAAAGVSHIRDIVRLSSQAVADVNRNLRLLAVSRATADFHVAQGLDAAKLNVVYNGVDLDAFQPRPPSGYLHLELELPREAMLIATIGQISIRKGFDTLARAAEMLAARLPQAHYLLVGERWSGKGESRELEQSLRAAAAGPLTGRLHLLGRRDDVPRLLNELAMLVHPARQEPLGRVLLEGAAAGLPIIATDVGGTSEIFPPSTESARLVRPDDAEQLALAIAELAADAERRRRLGAAARRRAEAAFRLDTAAAALAAEYRALLR